MDLRFDEEVCISAGKVNLFGHLVIPVQANAVIIFSHGSGSSRFSKRNQQVANYLHKRNFGVCQNN